jgi:CPA2 family monovalent cation:H+ antiporter-2
VGHIALETSTAIITNLRIQRAPLRYHRFAVSELPLLVDLAIALAYALVGGLLARRVGLPTIVGYLLAGVALGPFTAGMHVDEASIHQLAEFGVILLMFGIGMHFSFRDLWHVRDIAIPGALLQTAITTAVAYALARSSGATPAAALVLGFAVSVASTVVLLRGLMDTGLLDSLHGRVAVGWLVLEDLATVVILVLLPLLALPAGGDTWRAPLFAVGKALVFVLLMLSVGPRLVPLLMARVVRTRSRELFVLVALCAAVGTALASAAFFGVSLALGAFLAGVIFGESEFSHQVSADLLPFREAFAVLFFVSVGMLVNPGYLASHWRDVLVWSALIVFGKWLITIAIGVFFPYPARTSIVVAAGLSQIGEFSFIVGQGGLALGLITTDQYSLILAGAVVSITINPLMFRTIDRVEHGLRRWPTLWRWLDRVRDDAPPVHEGLTGHVVIVGSGRVGRHIAEALGRLQIPRIVVEVDPARLTKLRELGVPVLYGDAGNSEILDHADLGSARALVITLPDDAAALAVAETARKAAPNLRIVSRASTWDGARRLQSAGVDDIVRPELEGGVEIVRRTLLDLDLPVGEVQRYADTVRREGLDGTERPSSERARLLNQLLGATGNLEITWIDVDASSPVAGRTLGDAALRGRTGASVVAIARGADVQINPGPEARIDAGDRLAVIGTTTQIQAALASVQAPSAPRVS